MDITYRTACDVLARSKDADGQSLAEYVILVMVIAFVVLAAAAIFGPSLSSFLQSAVNAF
jgi:Flp pilus assembly pilin Flp